VLIARDVFGYVGAASFGVTHFTENFTAWAGDAFDREYRAIRVVFYFHGWVSIEVGVLRSDLSVCSECSNIFFAGDKFAFTVRKWNVVEVTYLGICEPWRHGGCDTRGGVACDMSADVIEGKSWLTSGWLTDFALGDEASFDEGLEAVANTENESVAVFE